MAISDRPLETLQTASPPQPLTYEDFLAWALGEEMHTEWVNGEVMVYMSATPLHQERVIVLTRLLGLFVDVLRLGKVYTGLMQMKLPAGASREPDVFFVAHDHLGRVLNNRLDGPPIWSSKWCRMKV
jgi:Uma2 family endonuclease